MATRYYFTTAPADYDYRACTRELLTGVADRHGTTYRLVSITDEGGGTFHEGQPVRYQSGMHAVWEVGSEDAMALGLPTLADLGVDLSPLHERSRPTQRAARRAATVAVRQLGAQAPFADAHDRAMEVLDERGYEVDDAHLDTIEQWVGERLSQLLS